MAELKPLFPIAGQMTTGPEPTTEKTEQAIEKVEGSKQLLKAVNGDLCFEIEYDNGLMLVSLDKCKRHIALFKEMSTEEQLTFLEQAAIFGANPFGAKPDIWPVPFETNGKKTYAPVIYYQHILAVASKNPRYNGYESGVVVETKKGEIVERKGQVYLETDRLIGGWCRVVVKGLELPVYRSVNLKEFERRKNDGTLMKFWKDSPANQIEKCAIANALGIALKMPKFFIPEELPTLDITHDDVSDQKALTAKNDQFFNKK
jgi:hypothetical protein